MNWKFWQKKETAPELRRIGIPSAYVREIKALHDAHNALPVGQDKESHYLLWEAIGEAVPETLEGAWTLKHPTATTAEVVERLPRQG